MKKYLVVCAFCASFFTTYTQTTLYSESFETDGEGSRYFSTTFSYCAPEFLNNPDYFVRTNTNPVSLGTCSSAFGSSLTNLQGSWFWASEDIRSNYPGPRSRSPGYLTTSSINITNYTSLTVSLYVATASNNNARWETDDSINIQVRINGGSYVTVGRFVGDNAVGGRLRIDSDLNGTGEGVAVDQANFAKYTFSIPYTGTTMDVNLYFEQVGGTEEFAFDLIEVKGTLTVPVELLSFDVKQSDDDVQLLWSTASEKDNAYFRIERSSDNLHFETLDKVEGHGNSQERLYYHWTDINPNIGISYYRLAQVDFDGKESYSNIQTVVMDKIHGNIIASPNPFHDAITLQFTATTSSLAKIVVHDLNGRMVYSQAHNLSTGLNTLKLNLETLAAGVYILDILTPNTDSHSRIVKL